MKPPFRYPPPEKPFEDTRTGRALLIAVWVIATAVIAWRFWSVWNGSAP